MIREGFEEVIIDVLEVLLLHLAQVYEGVTNCDERNSNCGTVSDLSTWT